MCFTAGGGSSAKGQTQGVVERKTTMPILSSLLCEAKGNRLTITATGLELGIRTGCEAKVKKEGSGTIRMRFAARGAAVGRGPARPTGGQDRPTGAGDRFFEGVLLAHRRAAEAAGGDWKNPLCLPADPDPKGRSRSLDRETHVRFGGEPGGFLSLSAPLAGAGSRPGGARHHAADCGGVSQLRLAADDRGTETARLAVNHKHVYRLLREDNLLCPRQQKFLVTTDSDQGRVAHARVAAATGVRRLLADYWRLVGTPTSLRRRRRLWRGQRVWSDGAAPNAGETGAFSGGAGQSAALPRWRRAGGNGAAASRDGSSSSSPYSP